MDGEWLVCSPAGHGRVHDGLESAHVVRESLSVHSNSNRMFAFLKLTAPSHFLSSRSNDYD